MLDHRQDNRRGVRRVAIDAVGLLDIRLAVFPGLAGAGIQIETRIVAGGDGGTQAMPTVEDDARAPAIDADFEQLKGHHDVAWALHTAANCRASGATSNTLYALRNAIKVRALLSREIDGMVACR